MKVEENISAGIFFFAADTERFLYLLRHEDKTHSNWGLPGGKIEHGETLLEGLERECVEELGLFPQGAKLIPIQKFVNHNFTYHTFFCKLEHEFIPVLNHEHDGYCWTKVGYQPKPLHPGLFNTINFDVVQDKIQTLIKKAA